MKNVAHNGNHLILSFLILLIHLTVVVTIFSLFILH